VTGVQTCALPISGPDEPGTDEPGTDEPGTDEPGTDEPGTDEPGTDEPGTDEPGTEEPGTEEPGTEEPGTEEPGTEEPGVLEPFVEDPPAGGRIIDKTMVPISMIALLSLFLLLFLLRRRPIITGIVGDGIGYVKITYRIVKEDNRGANALMYAETDTEGRYTIPVPMNSRVFILSAEKYGYESEELPIVLAITKMVTERDIKMI
jgi:hypothetical protein